MVGAMDHKEEEEEEEGVMMGMRQQLFFPHYQLHQGLALTLGLRMASPLIVGQGLSTWECPDLVSELVWMTLIFE